MQNPFRKKKSGTPWIITTFLLAGILIGLGIQTMFSQNDEKIMGGGDTGFVENTEIENITENNTQKNIEPQKTAEEIFQEIAEEIGLKKDDFSACLTNGFTAEEVKKDAEDGRSYGVTSTPTFFINGRMVVGALPYNTFSAIFEEELAEKAPAENRITVSTDDDLALGEPAPITMIEFSDFQCPYCARFHADAFPQIQENYIKTGKVRYVMRDFPLASHTHAAKAAQAVECAKMQGAWSSKSGEMERIYFEYVDKLFERSGEWSNAV